MENNNILSLHDFQCGYAEFTLEKLNLTVQKGEFLGVIGPNGAGKSTLLKGISGLINPLAGEMIVSGTNLHKLPHRERAQKIAVVPQRIEAEFISVEEFVLMGRAPYHSRFQFFDQDNDRKIARKYMELTNTYHMRHKMMDELSGGEQQMVALAKALTQEPEILLLDEPTSHLDISHQVESLNLVQRLNKELGITIIIVIHDLNLAAEYCSRIVLMKKASIFQEGTPEEVINYQNIEEVYGTVVVVQKSPISGRPIVFLVSEQSLKPKNTETGGDN